ncbi:helix-turn-helix transcriptional regulator [Azospirillum sp. SYSU D00513]|uniref:helix-turn-helix domain-containing protein n=1 Tax=Azospirillum sp. SYSU D00513 TaxID=2812561 RepID=UPI001A95A24C|nr:helix-turn-helix transcriptional regulator [Azospirillum sp. SYSU D00513]
MARGRRKNNAAPEEDEGGPDAVDVHVGARIRLRRTLLGMNQTRLAEAVGLTFQQIQKYEKGSNRVSSSKLWQFSRALHVPVSFFFDDLPDDLRARAGLAPAGLPSGAPDADAAPAAESEMDVMNRRETLELMKAFSRIDDPAARQRLFEMFKTIGDALAARRD